MHSGEVIRSQRIFLVRLRPQRPPRSGPSVPPGPPLASLARFARRRQSMARELASLLDLGAKRGARREFDAIALRGERFDPRAKITRMATSTRRPGVSLGTGKP